MSPLPHRSPGLALSRAGLLLPLCLVLSSSSLLAQEQPDPSASLARPIYASPAAIEVNPTKDRIYVALGGPAQIVELDLAPEAAQGERLRTWDCPDRPTGMTFSPDGDLLAVTCGEAQGLVQLIDLPSGQAQSFPVGFSPLAPVFLDSFRLAVCHWHIHQVIVYEIPSGRVAGQTKITREPVVAALAGTGESRRLFVGNHLPAQPATRPHVASLVEVLDPQSLELVSSILLPNGCNALKDMCTSPDGRYVLTTHHLGHHQVPTNQLERGWMNANALSVIDADSATLLATILLDDTTRGAANPWGVTFSEDGAEVYVAHAGTHEVTRFSFPSLLGYIEKHAVPDQPSETGGYREGLENDLRTMVSIGRERVTTLGKGPRMIAAAAGRTFVCDYFGDGSLTVITWDGPGGHPNLDSWPLRDDEPQMDEIRLGELRFADASLCFQGWQSCISCHPAIRADGLNWDLLNDGIGNPKQSKSMLFSHATPPVMGLGVRADAETAVRAGIRFIQFAAVNEDEATSIDAYLKSLQPLPSPHLDDEGNLSTLALRGRELFHGKAACAACHHGPYFTDLKSHPIRHAAGPDLGKEFDTPTLREVWRTAPYLYDGRTMDMAEALRLKSAAAETLTIEEMDALVAYVLSL